MKTDALGHAEGFVTIPAGIPSGTKLVTFWGNQGSYGETTYTGRGLITTEERQKVVLVRRASVDPLAQTFTLAESRFIGGVEVWFTAKGTGRVKAQIRETNLGMPTSNVLSEGEITADTMKPNTPSFS